MRSTLSKSALVAFSATMLVALSPVALAQGSPPAGMAARAPTTAPAYLQMASSGDMFEIQSSQLALQTARDPELKRTAQMIIDDHTRLSTELKAAATSAGIAPPAPGLAPHHARMLDQLRSAGAANFDRTYRQQQITAHQEALTIHRTYASRGDVPALRQAASRAVPVIEMHLQHVQSPRAGTDAATSSKGGGAGQSGGRSE
jgi:putative membrane protein